MQKVNNPRAALSVVEMMEMMFTAGNWERVNVISGAPQCASPWPR
jgi:hypothetical protein